MCCHSANKVRVDDRSLSTAGCSGLFGCIGFEGAEVNYEPAQATIDFAELSDDALSMEGNAPRRGISATAIEEWSVEYVSIILDIPVVSIDPTKSFSRLGLDSASELNLLAALEDWLGLPIQSNITEDCQSIRELATY